MTLQEFFTAHPKLALAFSGGTDSAFLLYSAKRYGCDVRPYFIRSAFQPAFELHDAEKLCSALGLPLTVLTLDVLQNDAVAANPADRCYHCKQALFTALLRRAAADGYPAVMDGNNASDDDSDRPGMRAVRELGVLSPLRACGFTKDRIRAESEKAGLFTWNKPAYACLATRVPAGTHITVELLEKIERAECALFALGFTDFRVRMLSGAARLQLPAAQMARALEKREAVLAALSADFSAVMLDLQAR